MTYFSGTVSQGLKTHIFAARPGHDPGSYGGAFLQQDPSMTPNHAAMEMEIRDSL